MLLLSQSTLRINTDVLHHIMVPGFLPCFEFLVNVTGFSILVFEVLKLVFLVLVLV